MLIGCGTSYVLSLSDIAFGQVTVEIYLFFF